MMTVLLSLSPSQLISIGIVVLGVGLLAAKQERDARLAKPKREQIRYVILSQRLCLYECVLW